MYYNFNDDDKPKASDVFKNQHFDSHKKIRKGWGDISPVQKVVPDKKKLRDKKEKYKKDWRHYDDDE